MTPKRTLVMVCNACGDRYEEPMGAVINGTLCPTCRSLYDRVREAVAGELGFPVCPSLRRLRVEEHRRGVEEIRAEVLM